VAFCTYTFTKRKRDTKNLIIIGTSHISWESLSIIKKSFQEHEPDIVAVELDRNRLYALLNNIKTSKNPMQILRVGVKGYVFALVGSYLQRKLGNMVGTKPGSDMLTAIKLAQKHKKPIALVDQDISITLRRFSQKTKASDKWRFFFDIISSPFRKDEKITFDLNKNPDEKIVNFLLDKMKRRYPSFYRVLVEERNKHIAQNLFLLMKKNPNKKVLCVLGAGHKEGVLKKLNVLGAQAKNKAK